MSNPSMRNMVKLIESAIVNEADPERYDDMERDADGHLVHPNIKYTGDKKKITADLSSYESQVITKLGQQVKEAVEKAAELKTLEESIKASAREQIGALFAPADELVTRIVETQSLTLQLKVAAKDVPTTKYASVVEEFKKILVDKDMPELLGKLNGLIAQYTEYGDKAGALSYKVKESEELNEGALDKFVAYFQKLASAFAKWGSKFDADLDHLKSLLPVAEAFGGPGYVNQGGENMNDSSALNEDADNQAIEEMNDCVNDALQELNSLKISFDNSGHEDETLDEAMEEFFHAAIKFKAALSAIAGTDLPDAAF
jgi:hypothetical protein